MTTIKHLSTGLIAIALLTTSAVGHENFTAGRHVIGRDTASTATAGRWFITPGGIPVWFGPSVRGRPGNICDDADNGRIC
ncbi:hypothetical protein [Bradyrhizobium lablabi]|uniref:hypothetical protein n=1 Tax=Bradyrhizobium lablabi TaxID=722472 RepID=UPI001BA7531D|nr:hypothetical protein [Bradyrhizobium lablabi]MBR0694610.1 hypothetical protein [Bradyrhizobium lablabi]